MVWLRVEGKMKKIWKSIKSTKKKNHFAIEVTNTRQKSLRTVFVVTILTYFYNYEITSYKFLLR